MNVCVEEWETGLLVFRTLQSECTKVVYQAFINEYRIVPSKRPYLSKRPPTILAVSVVWVVLRVTAHCAICGIA